MELQLGDVKMRVHRDLPLSLPLFITVIRVRRLPTKHRIGYIGHITIKLYRIRKGKEKTCKCSPMCY